MATKNYTDQDLNPSAEHSERLFQDDARLRFNQENESRGVMSQADLDAARQGYARTDNPLQAAKKEAADAEQQTQPISQPKKQNFIVKFMKHRKMIAGLGIGGGLSGLIIGIIMFSLQGLQLTMFIENMTAAASRVPAYAVQERTEYLVTRALATRMLMLSSNNADEAAAQTVYCGGGRVACSLFATYTSDFFERKMDFKMEKRSEGRILLTVNSLGRDSLGSKARSWEVVVDNSLNGQSLDRTITEIKKNSEMKDYIKTRVNTDMKSSNVLSRYLARKILMKKYGVTHWRAFEKTSNSIAEKRIEFRKKMFQNTVGKVSQKTAIYLACFSGGESCARLLKDYSSSANIDVSQCEGKTTVECERLRARKAYIDQKGSELGVIDTDITDEEASSKSFLSNFISNKLLAAIGGPLAVIGLLDMISAAIAAVDNGVIDEVQFDIAAQTYTGFAFGDDVGLVPNNDRMKAGLGDADIMGEFSTMLEGAEASPLYAIENGVPVRGGMALLPTVRAAGSEQIARTCETPDGPATITLAKGELICPERKLVPDAEKRKDDTPTWRAIALFSVLWESSVINTIWDAIGDVADFLLGDVIEFIIDSTGLSKLGAWAIEKVIPFIMERFFNTPLVGYFASGAENYDAFSAGIRISQNELMINGVDEVNEEVIGAGGQVLTDEQIAQINSDMYENELDSFASQSVWDKLFNPRLKGSLAYTFAMTAPKSFGDVMTYPQLALGAVTQSGQLHTLAAGGDGFAASPFGMPIYGYPANSGVFTENPSEYTKEKCTELAMAREDSFGLHRDVSPVSTYAVTDPCALEKVAVGTALEFAGVRDDEYSLPEVDGTTPDGSSGSGSYDPNLGNPNYDRDRAELLARMKESPTMGCDPRTDDLGEHTTMWREWGQTPQEYTIRLCALPNLRSADRPSNPDHEYYIEGANGKAIVNSIYSTEYYNLAEAITAKYSDAYVTSAYRSNEYQAWLSASQGGTVSTAPQYTSNHEIGFALDFNMAVFNQCRVVNNVCTTTKDPKYTWLRQNGATFGVAQFKCEHWHWGPLEWPPSEVNCNYQPWQVY